MSKNKDMVIVCAIQHGPTGRDEYVVVVKKSKPEWQAGCYNLPGGKIEEGESPVQAAIREFDEEVGIKLYGYGRSESAMLYIGKFDARSTTMKADVHIYAVRLKEAYTSKELFREGDEVAMSILISELLTVNSPKLINNLRYVIPYCCAALDGFTPSLVFAALTPVEKVDYTRVQKWIINYLQTTYAGELFATGKAGPDHKSQTTIELLKFIRRPNEIHSVEVAAVLLDLVDRGVVVEHKGKDGKPDSYYLANPVVV